MKDHKLPGESRFAVPFCLRHVLNDTGFFGLCNFLPTFFQRIITNQQHKEPMTTQRKTRRRLTQRSNITTARAIKIAGGSVLELAERLGITTQAIYKWGNGCIPHKQARKLLEV